MKIPLYLIRFYSIRICLLLFLSTIFSSCFKSTPRFELIEGEVTGIQFNNIVLEEDSFNIMHYEYMYNGGGVGIGDLNNDGLPDLIFTGNKIVSKIYLNKGEFMFTDITSNFEGLTSDQWLSGVCVADVNADGWNDVYFTSTMSKDSLRRKNQLWINQGLKEGQPWFKEMAEAYRIADMGYSMHAAFLDYDLDGDLDLYVLNNVINKEVPTNYRIKITDGSAVNNDQLYQNLGNGTFKNVTKEAGIVFEGYGLGIAVGDVNKDGYPDLYISNDYIANDLLYINQRNGKFSNQSKDYFSYHSRFSMGNDMADMNNDGNLDIITMDMMPEQYFRKKQTINGNSYYVYVNNEKYNYEPQFVRNMLQVHNGFQDTTMLPFSEVAQMAGVYQTEWSWSPLFADFDNDGDKDLFITNGFPKDLTDKDFTNYKAQVYGSLADDAHMIARIPIVKVPNYAYENVGELDFVNQTQAWGMNIPSFSNGASFVDLDQDGDLDYVVNNINDPAFVYRNNTIGKINGGVNFIRIELKGNTPNLAAIGSKVELWSNGTYQYAEKFLSRGYISSVDPILHFGLGKSAVVDSIKVTWPSGKMMTVLKQIKANQVVTLNEDDAVPYVNLPRKDPNYLFSQVKGIIDFTHLEKDYIDFFQGQSIMPHKFSQIGPRMTKGDLTDDGLEDLLIGASNGQPTALFIRQGRRFVPAELAGLTGDKAGQESDLAILDIDKDGDNDVLAVTGGYTLEDEKAYQHFLYRKEKDGFAKEVLPLPPFPASVIRIMDFDHDGDSDVFIGCRVKKWGFPVALRSYLLVNEEGKLKADDKFTFDIDMVTDALWSDYDNDGWEDLLLAREWNSLLILKNENGQSLKIVTDSQIESKHGLWSSLAAGDFDHDGDEDYLAGNLGLNNRFTISEEYPMRVYAIDLDKNGFIDPVSTAYWKDAKGIMQEYPINYLDELASQSPFFRKSFTSYTKFSYTTAKEIINTDTIAAKRTYYVNTTSSFVLWNDKGKFTWQELPSAAQVAPIRKMLVDDFNGDKIQDVLVAGNDYTYDVSTGYYNANKGLILLGSGSKSFKVLLPSQSGLLLSGQVESLIYLKGDTSYLVSGINRRPLQVHQYIYKQQLVNFNP
ncbi:MAG: VCBS repeat-containing protein [Bacteroidota bacterium]